MGDEADQRLVWSVKNGELENVKEIVEKEGKDVNKKFEGRCPLHYAADYGHRDVIEYLLQKGADINVKDKFEITPLLSAIYEGHSKCVELLLEKGAKSGKSPDGTDYIDCAESQEIKELLKKHKC